MDNAKPYENDIMSLWDLGTFIWCTTIYSFECHINYANCNTGQLSLRISWVWPSTLVGWCHQRIDAAISIKKKKNLSWVRSSTFGIGLSRNSVLKAPWFGSLSPCKTGPAQIRWWDARYYTTFTKQQRCEFIARLQHPGTSTMHNRYRAVLHVRNMNITIEAAGKVLMSEIRSISMGVISWQCLMIGAVCYRCWLAKFQHFVLELTRVW